MIQCDPDDYVESDYFESLYREAQRTNADVVVCNYYREAGEKTAYITQHYNTTPSTSIENFYKNPFFPSQWDTLIRTAIIQNHQIYPYTGINTGEDLNVIFRVFLKAKTLAYVPKAFYHYVRRADSLTQGKDILQLWNKNIAQNLEQLSKLLNNERVIKKGRVQTFKALFAVHQEVDVVAMR